MEILDAYRIVLKEMGNMHALTLKHLTKLEKRVDDIDKMLETLRRCK